MYDDGVGNQILSRYFTKHKIPATQFLPTIRGNENDMACVSVARIVCKLYSSLSE
jgi:hypothetical protein